MAEPREVRIYIGKRSYLIQTELDDDSLNMVIAIVNEFYESITESAEPDSRLMLTCLQLAYNLKQISERLTPLDKKLNELNLKLTN